MKLVIGSVVRLKSGGPKMTVDNIGRKLCEHDDSTRTVCCCRWMTRDCLPHTEWFDFASLELVNEEL